MRKKTSYRVVAVICAFIFTSTISFAQRKTISGVVSDEAGKPLEGATVSQKGGTAATTTNKEGVFKIDVASTARVLIVSYVGMDNVEISIGNRSNIPVTLRAVDARLGEVVVIGYGKAKRANLTTSQT